MNWRKTYARNSVTYGIPKKYSPMSNDMSLRG